jgi:hypothetical protein
MSAAATLANESWSGMDIDGGVTGAVDNKEEEVNKGDALDVDVESEEARGREK